MKITARKYQVGITAGLSIISADCNYQWLPSIRTAGIDTPNSLNISDGYSTLNTMAWPLT